jgi:hypothetical protein
MTALASPVMFPQVNTKCGSEKTAPDNTIGSLVYTSTLRSDLLRYAAEVQSKTSPSRMRRHRLSDGTERRVKLINETGFDLAGIMCEPPQETWARPDAQPVYHRVMRADPGRANINEYTGPDLRHLAWMVEAELVDIEADGSIWPLSDVELTDRRYPGAPVGDARARIGRTHTAERVEELVMTVFDAIKDGNPVYDIPAEWRREMAGKKGGIRISARMFTGHVNRLLSAEIDAACNCLGRDLTQSAWDLPDHGINCPGQQRYLHVEVVRKAVARLVKSGDLDRISGAILTRKGHTEHRIPCAYAIPADAGWHKYAAMPGRTKHTRWSPLRTRLLGTSRQGTPPPMTLEDQ